MLTTNRRIIINHISDIVNQIPIKMNAYVTGSSADNSFRSNRFPSDIDILLVFQSKEDALASYAFFSKQSYHFAFPISIIHSLQSTIESNYYSGLCQRTDFLSPLRSDFSVSLPPSPTQEQLYNSLLQHIGYYYSKYISSNNSAYVFKTRKYINALTSLFNLLEDNDPFLFSSFPPISSYMYSQLLSPIYTQNYHFMYSSVRFLFSQGYQSFVHNCNNYKTLFSMVQIENMGLEGMMINYA